MLTDAEPGPRSRTVPSRPIMGDARGLPLLCELVFKDEPSERRRRYMMVLFASRRLVHDPAAAARDAIDTIRAGGGLPALTVALERAGVTDMATFAAAARRAATLSKMSRTMTGPPGPSRSFRERWRS